ncbi:MAG: hypothetical protein KGZ86_03160, partial [Candidatus Latescibacteria bacterium]|nr:hypothetical protein [Candidatus Latescibacterota bacterium]
PESLGEDFLNYYRIQKSLAVEEGVTKAAVEDWQDMLVTPKNINKVAIDDLYILQNVSLIDAVAVIKHLKMGREIKGYRDLRDINGLSNYGFRNIRNFISYTDPKSIKFSGNYRLNFDYGYDFDAETDPDMWISSITQGYTYLAYKTRFYKEGFSDADIEHYYTRLDLAQDYLAQVKHRSQYAQRMRVKIGDNLNLGLRWQNDLNPGGLGDQLQGFVQAYNISPFKKVFLGDYRVILGQGLLLDNSTELISRTYNRSQGLYGDLTSNSRFGFRGVAAEAVESRFKFIGFYSHTRRDAIENPDGTIFYYIVSQPRLPTNSDVLSEINYGGSARIDLSGIGFVPEGSMFSFNALQCRYDKEFSPLVKWVDLPNDATFFDDPNIVHLAYGKERNLYSTDFRTVIDNVALEGEYAWQKDGGKAFLLQSRVQYEYLYVLGLIRHFDVNYDNPYNRGFCEQTRFDDTPFEKTYRLIDPTFSALQSFPVPKAEQGIYLETRYQISRQITFTRAYVDVWRNVAHNLTNFRFQGEVEYRPVFPLRFRLKQKLQHKHLPKDVQATVSQTSETSFRILASLTERNFLSCEMRRGVVGLTPSMAYNNKKTMWGDFLSVSYEHNFSNAIGLETGIAVWKCDGLSQWIFEDVGIDFLDGQGLKYYFVMTQRPAKFLLLRLKFKGKHSEIPHSGILQAEGLHFADGRSLTMRDFVVHNDIFNVGLQVDVLW